MKDGAISRVLSVGHASHRGPRVSVKLMAAVLDSGLPPTERFVAVVLADYAKDDGTSIFPVVGSVVARTGLSERAVRSALSKLRRSGVLTREGTRAFSSGAQVPIYRMHPTELPARPAPPAGDAGRGGAPPAGRGVHHVPEPPAPRAPKPRTEPTTETTRSSFSSHELESERLSNLLADLIASDGDPRPHVGEGWLRECDRLIRVDRRTPDEIEAVIRWSQADAFWSSNILSMPKLRKQFTQLRRRMSNNGPVTRRGEREHPVDTAVRRSLEQAEELRRRGL